MLEPHRLQRSAIAVATPGLARCLRPLGPGSCLVIGAKMSTCTVTRSRCQRSGADASRAYIAFRVRSPCSRVRPCGRLSSEGLSNLVDNAWRDAVTRIR